MRGTSSIAESSSWGRAGGGRTCEGLFRTHFQARLEAAAAAHHDHFAIAESGSNFYFVGGLKPELHFSKLHVILRSDDGDLSRRFVTTRIDGLNRDREHGLAAIERQVHFGIHSGNQD